MIDKEKIQEIVADIFSRALVSGIDASMSRLFSRALSHTVCYSNNLPDACVLELETYINNKIEEFLQSKKSEA